MLIGLSHCAEKMEGWIRGTLAELELRCAAVQIEVPKVMWSDISILVRVRVRVSDVHGLAETSGKGLNCLIGRC